MYVYSDSNLQISLHIDTKQHCIYLSTKFPILIIHLIEIFVNTYSTLCTLLARIMSSIDFDYLTLTLTNKGHVL